MNYLSKGTLLRALFVAIFGLIVSHAAFLPATIRCNQPTRHLLWSTRSSNNDGDDDGDFMKSLQNRMQQVSDRETKLPMVVVDAMLPRQVLKIEVADPTFVELVRHLVATEQPYFGMLGMAELAAVKQTLPLQNGVQVEIVGQPVLTEDEAIRIRLRGGRRFRIQAELATSEHGSWTEARVRYLDSAQEEADEENGENPLSLARARQQARTLVRTQDNGVNLLDEWIALAKQHERNPGQIDELLEDLGERPSPDEPTELAFWVGALINPLPGMGVAMEIRPQLLMSRLAEERVLVALKGITDSIKHMDGSRKLF